MKRKICCFAGHGYIKNITVKDKIKEKAIELIENDNVNEFWVGNYGDFDAYAASAIQDLKEYYSEIQLNLIIPYLTKDINEYRELYYKKYDHIIMADMPLNTPQRYKIIKANQFMIDNSQYLICYVEHSWGGAAKTLEYARRKQNIEIYNLGD